jgi:hypothetical protein
VTKKPLKEIEFRWRHRLGMILFFACYPLFYAIPFVVPFLGFSAARSVVIIAMPMAAVYGIWLLSIPLLGMDGFRILRHKYFGWLNFRKWWKTRQSGTRH